MAFFLAIDAGATKTDAAIADESRTLARVRGATIKAMLVSPEDARKNLAALIANVCEPAQITPSAIASTCVGLAGVTVPEVERTVRSALVEAVGGKLCLCEDSEIALDAASPGGPGVLVMAGTGSAVLGRDSSGALYRAGGYGPMVSDEGSGFWIGREGVRAALHAKDNDERSRLLDAICRHWQIQSIAELIAFVNRREVTDFSTLSEVVAVCAQAGDRISQRVLESAGDALAELALDVLGRIAADPPQLAFTGSILEQVGMVRERMFHRLQSELPTIQIRDKRVDPIEGALYRARRSI